MSPSWLFAPKTWALGLTERLRDPWVRQMLLWTLGSAMIFYSALLVFKLLGFSFGVNLAGIAGKATCERHYLYLTQQVRDWVPQRGDYVLARMPHTPLTEAVAAYSQWTAAPGQLLIKRVAGLPGDRIQVQGTELYINGLHYDRLWLAKSIPGKQPGDFDADYVLGPGEYFLVGETQESFDSRYWGKLTQQDLLGRAWVLF